MIGKQNIINQIIEIMDSTGKIKVCVWIATGVLICGTASAQRRFHSHCFGGHSVTTVVVQPAVTIHAHLHITRKERLEMAVAYLNDNKYLSIKKYAGMTGLTKKMAEAELDAFSNAREKTIVMVLADKKKLYTLKK